MSNLMKEGLVTSEIISNPASWSAVRSLRHTQCPVSLPLLPFIMGHATVSDQENFTSTFHTLSIIHHSCPDHRKCGLLDWLSGHPNYVRYLDSHVCFPFQGRKPPWDPGLHPILHFCSGASYSTTGSCTEAVLDEMHLEEWLFIWRLLLLTVSPTHFNTDNFVPLTHSLIQ